jgi:hypothetical protein
MEIQLRGSVAAGRGDTPKIRPRGAPWARGSQALLWCLLGACGPDAASTTGSTGTPPTAAPGTGPNGSTLPPGNVAPPVSGQPSAPSPDMGKTDTPPITSVSPDGAPAAMSGSILPCGVSKIMVNSCQSCHGATPIGGAPMPLVSFEDFHKPATTQPTKQVYQLVQERIHDTTRPMPPMGELTATELSELDAWAQAGALSGAAADATCDTTPAAGSGSVAEMEHTRGRITPGPNETCYEFKVHASQTEVDDAKFSIRGGELYEQFYYKVPWPAGTVASAYATIADNAQVLHHWLLFSTNEPQTHGSHIEAPLPTLWGTDPVLLAGWAVGGPNLVAPDDVGFELPDPAGRTINVQWHFYNSTQQAQLDASSVQICTVPKEMKQHIGGVTWLGTEDLGGNIWAGGPGMPPNQESKFTTTCNPGRRNLTADQSIHIIGFEPHMHRIGKRMQTSIRSMDGTVEDIFDKPFSFGNETHYYVDYELKPGQQLITTCTFLNDTDKGIPFGESSDTEMCYQFTFAYPAHAISNGAFSLLGVTDTCW